MGDVTPPVMPTGGRAHDGSGQLATESPAQDTWEQNIVPLRVHINAWAALAIFVGLLHFKAGADNPSEFYNNLQWLTLLVSVFAIHVSLQHEFYGWTFVFAAIAVLFNPTIPLDLSRSAWLLLDFSAGGVLIASAVLLRWNIASRWITWPRDIIDKSVAVAVLTIVSGVVLHVVTTIVLLPISYLLSGDEKLIDDWMRWRAANPWLVGLGTIAVVWLYHWRSSPGAVRRFITEPRSRS